MWQHEGRFDEIDDIGQKSNNGDKRREITIDVKTLSACLTLCMNNLHIKDIKDMK